jgi:hypothetical protein
MYGPGGEIPDSDLTASQLQARYGIPKNSKGERIAVDFTRLQAIVWPCFGSLEFDLVSQMLCCVALDAMQTFHQGQQPKPFLETRFW